MAKLNYNSADYNGVNGDLIGIISTLCIMFCMIVTVLGIKLKWFKHRMNFEQIPQSGSNNTTNNGGDNFRNTSENRLSQTAMMHGHGVFRKIDDDEIPIERPKTLPPIRIKNSSRLQLNVIPTKVNNKNDNIPDPPLHLPPLQPNDDISVAANREIFKNMQFNSFPSNTDLFPKVHNQQKQITKVRSKSPKKNPSPIKDAQLPQKNQSTPRQHRSKSPQKQRSNENPTEETKKSIDKRLKKSAKTTNFLELDIDTSKINNKKKQQFEKLKEEKSVKFADNTAELIKERRPTGYLRPEGILNNDDDDDDDENLKDISTRRPTGFVRPTKEEMDELDNFDHIIDEIDQQYPGTVKEKNGQLVFKIDGLNDNEYEEKNIKRIPKPEPRSTIKNSLEKPNEPINIMPLASLNSEENHNNETDSWSAVRQHRNLTQEMAKHHQAIRDAAQIKAAKRQLKNPLAYDIDINQKSNFNDTKNDKHHFNGHNPRLSNNSTEA